MESGRYAIITLMQIVASSKMQLRLETSDDDIYLEKLANDGVRHLDSLSIFVKCQAEFEVVDNKVKLPDGFHNLILLNCGNHRYVDLPFLSTCGCDTSDSQIQDYTGSFQIVNGYIHFNSDMSDTEFVTIVYWGLNVDEDGAMVVYQDYERALVAYICWMYTLQNASDYNQYVITQWKNVWIAQKKWIKSNDVYNDFRNTKRQMAEVMNATIVDKNWSI